MKNSDLSRLKERFAAYADWFIARAKDPAPYILKKEHTFRVCREIVALGREMRLSAEAMALAEAAACLHDIGRFRQLRKYGTFIDDISEDHARLGLKVIQDLKLTAGCTDHAAGILKTAVAFHNAAALPVNTDEKTLFFIRLLRDADKLDIWNVVTANYRQPDAKPGNMIRLGLPEDDRFSPDVLQSVMDKRLVNRAAIRRLNDFKLMQISWVFDINFAPTMARVKERGYIPAIIDTMPAVAPISAIARDVQAYMEAFTVAN